MPTIGSIEYYWYAFLGYLSIIGFQNLLAMITLCFCVVSLIKQIRKVKLYILILISVLVIFLSYSLFTLEGNLRLLVAQYGYPRIAYTFDRECISELKKTVGFGHYMVDVKTHYRNVENNPIMPKIEVYKFGILYYSKVFMRW